MTATKRKKTSRLRGSHTHGWGAKKKHRGAGSRGGKGMAGTGKRGDAKKPSIWKNKKYFGKHGFKKLSSSEEIKPINISYFEENLDKLLSEKLIEHQGDLYIIDVKKLGFNKVLGCGKLTNKYKISSPYFSKKVVEKIKAAGGEAIETKKKVKPETKENSEKQETKPKQVQKSEKPAAKSRQGGK